MKVTITYEIPDILAASILAPFLQGLPEHPEKSILFQDGLRCDTEEKTQSLLTALKLLADQIELDKGLGVSVRG